MLTLLLAAQLAATDPAPKADELRLICRGALPTATTVYTGSSNTTLSSSSLSAGPFPARINADQDFKVTEHGTRGAWVSMDLVGTSGEIHDDTGRDLKFKNAEVSPTKIVAKFWVGLDRGKFEVDRLTGIGEISFYGMMTYFSGACEKAPDRPTVPKF